MPTVRCRKSVHRCSSILEPRCRIQMQSSEQFWSAVSRPDTRPSFPAAGGSTTLVKPIAPNVQRSARAEVDDRAAQNQRCRWRRAHGRCASLHQHASQHEIPDNRYESVGQMKSSKVEPSSAGVVAAVAPGVAQVPNKVVQQRELNGRGRGVKIVARAADD